MNINTNMDFDERINSGELFNKAQIERKFESLHKKYGDKEIYIAIDNNLGEPGELYDYSYLVLRWEGGQCEKSLICSLRPVEISSLLLPEILKLEDLVVTGKIKSVYVQVPKDGSQYNFGYGNRNIEIGKLYIDVTNCVNLEKLLYKTEVHNLSLASKNGCVDLSSKSDSIPLDKMLKNRVDCIVFDESVDWIQLPETVGTKITVRNMKPIEVVHAPDKIEFRFEDGQYKTLRREYMTVGAKREWFRELLKEFMIGSKRLKSIIAFGEIIC